MAASTAAEAAALRGNFWGMHDMLFLNQPALDDDDLLEYATSLNLDLPRFEKDRGSPGVQARVRRDVDTAMDSGEVLGTPTLFIDGAVHLGGYNTAALLEALGRPPSSCRFWL
jgi:protein-disulfide isomerase